MSSAQDEYWSPSQRANVEAARDAGVSLAFFSGNEVFWKTRWEASIAGPPSADRTLVAYKDTHYDARVDPVAWTGTWQDPRFSPPGDGGRPQNALTGQLFTVNGGLFGPATSQIRVPAAYRDLRLWRNTDVATLPSGGSLALGMSTLGFEWDEDFDNGFRPAGAFRLSSTTLSNVNVFTDYGSVQLVQPATHHLMMYRAASGALVFGAGTVQWSWGLDSDNPGNQPPDRNVRQATVNLLADMGAQPATPPAGVVAATKSADVQAPSSTLTSPPETLADGTSVTLTGTAADAGGGVVAGVEVSGDGGATSCRGDDELDVHMDSARQPGGPPHAGGRRQRQHRTSGARRVRGCPVPVLDLGNQHPAERSREQRRDADRARGSLSLRHVRDGDRHPVLQVGRQRGDPYGQPLDRRRYAPGTGDVQRRERDRLADGDLCDPCADRRRHDICRVVLHTDRPLCRIALLVLSAAGTEPSGRCDG